MAAKIRMLHILHDVSMIKDIATGQLKRKVTTMRLDRLTTCTIRPE